MRLALAVFLACASAASAGKPVVLGYYPYWVANRFPPTAIDFKSFTHICHAFLMSDKDGNLKLDEGSVPSSALTETARKAGVKTLLSLGGAGSDAYFNVQSPKAQDAFVQGAVSMMAAYGYDGLDLDWEHPNSAETMASHLRMSQGLRTALDALGRKNGRTYLLTAAVPSTDWNGKWYDAGLLKVLDFINIMTYDNAGPWHEVVVHNAPLNASPKDPWGGAVAPAPAYWMNKGWPKEKLNLGIPCYGRGADVSTPYSPQPKSPKSKYEYADYKDILPLLAAGWTRTWDAEAKAPWISSPGKDAVMGYDDPESVGHKAAYAKSLGLGGIFFWDIHADRLDDGSSPLVAAARKAFLQ